MKQPAFITFTGVDWKTPLIELQDINAIYPVEFGILVSNSNPGNRYMVPEMVNPLLRANLMLSLHLCGSAARNYVMERELPDKIGLLGESASRIQINGDYPASLPGIKLSILETSIILQWRRDRFPDNPYNNIEYLFDKSGGRGKFPKAADFPPTVVNETVGYSGGITPDNVTDFIKMIPGSYRFWIDMETGVRTDDWFDVKKVWEVCRKVYRE